MTGRLATGAWMIAAVFAGAIGANAQVQSVDTSQPIVIKSSKPANPRHVKFFGEFVSSTPDAVTLRDPKNIYSIRTFSYAPEVRATMLRVGARGGYRYGDKVEIEYVAGSDVALRIKGRPSS